MEGPASERSVALSPRRSAASLPGTNTLVTSSSSPSSYTLLNGSSGRRDAGGAVGPVYTAALAGRTGGGRLLARATDGTLGSLGAEPAVVGGGGGGGTGARLGAEPSANDEEGNDEVGMGGIGIRLGPLPEGGGAGNGGSEPARSPDAELGGAGGAERGGVGAGGKLYGFDPAAACGTGIEGGRGEPTGGAGKPTMVSRFGRSLPGMMLGLRLRAVGAGAKFLMLAIGVFV